MKSFLILLLLFLLAGAAWFTRPSQESFTGYFDQLYKVPDNVPFWEKWEKQGEKDRAFKALVFRDRILWVQMERDGQVQYVGALSHWFDKTKPTEKPGVATPAK
jgi:hypothetical protein